MFYKSLLIFYRLKGSKAQNLILLEEKVKAKEAGKLVCWAELTKMLNAKGPCIKHPKRWKEVNKKLWKKDFKTYLWLILFRFTISV